MAMSNKKRTALHEGLLIQIRQFIAGVIFSNQQVAEHAGLRLSDMQCINVLDLLGPSTPGRLAQRTGLTTGGVTVMLDRLELAGYVKRMPNPDDRRSILVSVNRRQLRKIHAYYDQITEQTVAVFLETPEAELEAVARFFSRINAIRVERLPLPQQR
jgi:DNA-binding MarR family transcriptional regulator